MNIARLTIGWTVMLIWGWAYMMPAVPTFMLVAWVWYRGRGCIGPAAVGAALIWASYQVTW